MALRVHPDAVTAPLLIDPDQVSRVDEALKLLLVYVALMGVGSDKGGAGGGSSDGAELHTASRPSLCCSSTDVALWEHRMNVPPPWFARQPIASVFTPPATPSLPSA